MSVEFNFAAVPFEFERDGALNDLCLDVPVGGDLTEHLRPGVTWLGVRREKEIPLPLGLGLNRAGTEEVNEHSGDALGELLTGSGGSQSYILLHTRRCALERLKNAAPDMPNFALRTFVEVFIENAEAALSEYGNRAALVIL